MPAPPQARKPRRPKGGLLPSLSLREAREPLTLTVSYRGGSECWYEVRARGRTWRRPGVIALHDLMRDIYGQS